MAARPPLYKEIMVGLMVGGMLGPLVGWFIGTVATFFAVVEMDTDNVRRMRSSGFVGGLIGIPFGLVIGLAISLPLRLLSSRVFHLLKNPWLGGTAGTIIGCLCSYVILSNWYPSSGSLVYVVMFCMVMGAAVGSVTVIAQPKWLHSKE